MGDFSDLVFIQRFLYSSFLLRSIEMTYLIMIYDLQTLKSSTRNN